MANMSNRRTSTVRRCGCQSSNARAALLRHVQMHGFAMTEAGLYLDGHPDCRRALEYFRRQCELYQKYATEYEAVYGPLTNMAQTDSETWNWAQGPWPWESEAN